MSAEVLTIADVVALGTILSAAQQTAHVRWVEGDKVDIHDGVARCIAHDGGGFLTGDEDVRDGVLARVGYHRTVVAGP